MRDIVIFAIVLWGCVKALRHPWIGVMTWTWISIMNPHRQAWGFIYNFPVAAMVAAATLIGIAITKDERRNPVMHPAVVFLILFTMWICIGQPFSFYPEENMEMFSKVLKVNLMLLVTLALLQSKKHIETFVWVNVLSLGILGVKGGIFTIVTGGAYRVWGPGGFIGGNNEVALAFVILIPLMYYLYQTNDNKWVKRGLLASMLLTAAAALGSHSRGALLAVSAMAGFLWWRSDKKLVSGMVMLLAGVLLIAFMPEEWGSRMGTIKSYEEDQSAMGRINAWWLAWNLALDHPLFGGGFNIYEADLFARYAPNPNDIHVAHSIYFSVLGEQGWGGLILWLGIWIATWRAAGWIQKTGKKSPETMWCNYLGAAAQVSLIGYAVGGAFLSLAYFDLPYNVMIMVVLARDWMFRRSAEQQQPALSAQSYGTR